MATRQKKLSVISLFLFLLTPVFGLSGIAKEKPAIAVGTIIPNIEAGSVEGVPVSFYPPQGKLNLLSFLQTDTIQSVEALKELIVFYRRFHEHGLNMISVFTDSSEDVIVDLASLWQIPWPLVRALDMPKDNTAQTFSIPKTPSNLLIDETGRVLALQLTGAEAHTAIASFLHVSLDTIPMPDYPTPVSKRPRVTAPEETRSPLTKILNQYGYPTYVDPIKAVEFEAVFLPSITILQVNSPIPVALGWRQGDAEHVLLDRVESNSPQQYITDLTNNPFSLFVKTGEGISNTWYTDPQKNRNENHAKIYPYIVNAQKELMSYLIAWELNPIGTLNDDYQDLIIRIGLVKPHSDQPKQMEAIEAITAYGGFLTYNEKNQVVEVNLVYGKDDAGNRVDCLKNSDSILSILPNLPDLQMLGLRGAQATSRGMEFVGQLTNLEKLYMWDSLVNDEGVSRLLHLDQLKYLHMGNAQVTDLCLSYISKLPKLEGLALQQNRFTDEGLKYLARMTQLKSLWIGMSKGKISDAGMIHLANLINLEQLDLQSSQVTDAGLENFKGLKKLKELYLDNTSATPNGAKMLEEAIPGLKVHFPGQ